MGHGRLRRDKRCLNCGAEVQVRFCTVCGQENIEPKETLGSLIHHFFSDITHFDGKFFSTARKLITRPGHLSREYVSGKRASYLHPVRMYVFTSALFFLIFFSVYNFGSLTVNEEERRQIADSVAADLRKEGIDVTRNGNPNETMKGIVKFGDDSYKSVSEYDSVQKRLPKHERDDWFERRIAIREIELSGRYKDRSGDLTRDFLDKLFHSFPYLLFVSLPLYALYLKLLYHHNRKLYYADHGIFLVHLYIFTFLLLIAVLGLKKIADIYAWGWLAWVSFFILCYGVYYAFAAMKHFYRQNFGKTMIKFVLFNTLCAFSLLGLFILFLMFSVLRM